MSHFDAITNFVYITIKRACLFIIKYLGGFYLSGLLTQKSLQIICYHGFNIEDEVSFRPKLFITYNTFCRRLEFLKRSGYAVLSLDEALEKMTLGCLPNHSVVITIDDGFYGVYAWAYKLLDKFALPATVYVTSYYMVKNTPIFRLVVQYMFWKTTKSFLDCPQVGSEFPKPISLENERGRIEWMWRYIKFGEEQCTEEERLAMVAKLGVALDVNFESIEKSRIFSLMNEDEVQKLAKKGMDIQLHTHRHRLPLNKELVKKEIAENRACLEPIVGRRMEHLCYPSGQWSHKHWVWLKALGIKSSVTCDSGLNYQKTPRLGLKRFLDSEYISQIEFESELCGFNEILRKMRSVVIQSIKRASCRLSE